MTYIFLAQGFEEIEAIAVIDTLRRAGVSVTVVSIMDELAVRGAHDIVVMADVMYGGVDFEDAQMLILPGGMPGTSNLAEFAQLNDLLVKHNNAGRYIAAICAAPIVLGRLGILEGRKAVCYPSFEPQLIGATVGLDRVMKSDNIITSRGPGSAIEFAYEIILTLNPHFDIEEMKAGMIVKD